MENTMPVHYEQLMQPTIGVTTEQLVRDIKLTCYQLVYRLEADYENDINSIRNHLVPIGSHLSQYNSMTKNQKEILEIVVNYIKPVSPENNTLVNFQSIKQSLQSTGYDENLPTCIVRTLKLFVVEAYAYRNPEANKKLLKMIKGCRKRNDDITTIDKTLKLNTTTTNLLRALEAFQKTMKSVDIKLIHPGSLYEHFPCQQYVVSHFFDHCRQIIWQTDTGKAYLNDYWDKDWECRRKLIRDTIFLMKSPSCRRSRPLCPPIYYNLSIGVGDKIYGQKYVHKDVVELPSWIGSLHNYIPNYFNVTSIELTKNIVYCLLINDTSYDEGEVEFSAKPNRVQIYIGESVDGIYECCVTNRRSHCNEARKMLQCICSHESYVEAVRDVSLVDEYLALASLLGYETAVVVLSAHPDKASMEKAKREMIDSDRDLSVYFNEIWPK